MARPSLKLPFTLNRKVTVGFLTAVILWNSATISNAGMAVFDSSNFAQLIKMFNQAKEQVESLNELKDTVNDTLKTIGSYGQIVLPMTNMRKVANQLNQDAQCLIPDLEQLMPNVSFDDLSFSICDGSSAYRKSLFVNPKDFDIMPAADQNKLIHELEKRRENVMADASITGLGAADIAQKNAEDLNGLADQVEDNSSLANDERTQLAAIAQGQAANIRATAQTNQLLAALLRVQSSFTIAAGVSNTSELREENEEGETN